MWGAVSSGLQPHPWHPTVIWASPFPNFPKLAPHLHRYNRVRVHSYAHPQHMKAIEHFVNFQYGGGMQSVVVYSLNRDTTAYLGFTLPQFSTSNMDVQFR